MTLKQRIVPSIYSDLICCVLWCVCSLRARSAAASAADLSRVRVQGPACDKQSASLVTLRAERDRQYKYTHNMIVTTRGVQCHCLRRGLYHVCIFKWMRASHVCCRRTTASTTSTRSRTCRSAVSTRVTNASLASSPNTPSGSGSRATFSGATSRCDPWRRPSGTDKWIINLYEKQ